MPINLIKKIIFEQNNREVFSWIIGGVIGASGLAFTGYNYFHKPANLTFEAFTPVSFEIPEWGETFNSLELSKEDGICSDIEFMTGQALVADQNECERSNGVFEYSFLDTISSIEITVMNNSERTLIAHSAALEIEYGEQDFHSCGADWAEAVPVTSEVTVSHSSPIPLSAIVTDCDHEQFSSFMAREGLEVVRLTGGDCRFNAELDTVAGEVKISDNVAACPAGDQSCENFLVGEFIATAGFRFVGDFDDPLAIPPNRPFRFKIEIENMEAYPNNMRGHFTINEEHRSPSYYFLRYDSCQRWPVN